MRRVRRQLRESVFRRVSPVGGRGASARAGAVLAVSAVAGVAALGIGVAPASAFVLTVDLAGAGTGAVTSSPAGINCSNTPGQVQTDCSFDFPNFTEVSLSAVPAGSFVFRGWSGTAGGTCGSGSTNPCKTSNFLFSNVSATATFGPPPDLPLVVTEPAVEPVGAFSAMLRGRVNPNDFAVSNCYFELGTTTDYGRKVPCLPSDLGSGTSDVAVSAGSGTLKAATTYHFRLVAKNVGGTRVGEDQTFTTAAYTANLSPLPGYGYELVSPPMTQGQRAKAGSPISSPTGDELFLNSSVGGLPGSEWLDAFGMTYVAQRDEREWRIVPISPSGVDYPSVGESQEPTDWSSDGQQTLWMPSLPGQQNSSTSTPVVRDRQGAEQIAGPTLVPPVGAISGNAQYVGGSDDLRTLVFATRARPALTGGVTDTRATNRNTLLVARRALDGTLTVGPVAHQAGTAMQPTCEMELADSGRTAVGAVSADGRKIFFSPAGAGCTGATQQRVWVKVDDSDPIDISAPQCSPGGCSATNVATSFEGASDDGNRVYLSTEQELLDGDGDTSLKRDLFEYTFTPGGGGTLRAVTSSSTAAGAGVSGVPRVSADGSRVYFVATGTPQVTTPNARGAVPVAGDPNFYVYERQPGDAAGTIAFIGKLATADSTQVFGADTRRAVQTSDDGRFLTFASRADLTGDRSPGDTHLDVFRYDAEQDDLRRLWSDAPEVNGVARTDGANLTPCVCGPESGARNKSLPKTSGAYMSQDGAVIGFSTTVALDPRDQNTTNDGYVWTAASDAVHLVTSGRGNESQDGLKFVSRSGNMIGLDSATGLVPEHTSGQTGAYVLMKGGGFAPPDPDPVPCSGDGCQGPGTAPAGSLSIGSIGFGGRGNVPLASGRVSASVRVSRLKAVSGSAGRLRVRVPGAGRISVAGSSVRRASRSASKAGSYSVRIALSSRARKALKKRETLKVRVRVSYRAKGGRSASKTVLVTFKVKKGGR